MKTTRYVVLVFIGSAMGLGLSGKDARGQVAAVPSSSVLEDAPLYGASAIVLPRGGAAVGGGFSYLFIDEEDFFPGFGDEIDISALQLGAAMAFGITDRLMIGASLPYLRIDVEAAGMEETLSGLGNLGIAAKGQFLRSVSGATSLAALAGVTLPTASGDFEVEDDDPVWTVGMAGSHSTGPASFHGGIGLNLIEDFTTVTYTASAVIRTAPNVRLGLDLLGEKPEDFDNQVTVGGGLRWLASDQLFLDGGVLFPVTDDVITAALSAALTYQN